MLRSLRHPAIVVAIIALLVATAGTATAATEILIKSSSQVRAGPLDASDLREGAQRKCSYCGLATRLRCPRTGYGRRRGNVRPTLAGIIGGRRLWTVWMISSGSMPCR